MSVMETMQFRIPEQVKKAFAQKCEKQGMTVSEGAREAIEYYLFQDADPADELEDIFADADEKLEAAALPEPSIDEIVAYCLEVRAERASQMLAG